MPNVNNSTHLTLLVSDELSPELTWQHFACIESTNSYLLSAEQPPNQLVSADQQTAGRGRRQQQWVDEGNSALFSLSTQFTLLNISAWPVQVALTLATTLNQLCREHLHSKAPVVHIKWPNDLYIYQQNQWAKCGGILVESTVSGQTGKVVTGAGINLAPIHATLSEDYAVGFLPLPMDKKTLIPILGKALFSEWARFAQAPELSTQVYRQLDLLHGKAVIASDLNNKTTHQGIASGINAQGHLLIKQGDEVHALTSQQRIRFVSEQGN